jgi:arylsulfatase A-like enzyme
MRSASLSILSLALIMNVVFAEKPKKQQKSHRPNIILLMAEDIGNDLSCYGHPGVKTPTLDALAAKGIRYNRFYTNASICSPSRTSIMMGMY